MIGPITHTIVASSKFLFTDTSELSGLSSGIGRIGGSPGGTARMSSDRCSEKGLDVYRC